MAKKRKTKVQNSRQPAGQAAELTPDEKTVARAMEMYEYGFGIELEDKRRLVDRQAEYDNMIDDAKYPTASKLSMPWAYLSVEEALPDLYQYLFPPTRWLRMNPITPGVTIEQIEKSEEALSSTFLHKMRFPYASLETLKDCLKLGVGFGIVEPHLVTAPSVYVRQVFGEEGVIGTSRQMAQSQAPQKTVRYRYVSPGQIITMGDGSCFNGTEAVSASFFVDTYTEQQLRNMYSEQPTDGENPTLKGNVEEIIAEAREMNFDIRVPVIDMVADLAGIDMKRPSSSDGEYIPIRIPVIKMFEANRHIWIANGKTLIYDVDSEFQTMRNPIQRCSAWRDATRMYPMNDAEAASGVSMAMNIWSAMMFDLVTQTLQPTAIVDKSRIPNPEPGPNNTIMSDGPVRDAYTFAQTPTVPPGVFNFGDFLNQAYGSIRNQQSFLRDPQPGLMRGGGHAFRDLLSGSTGRKIFAARIIEMGFIEPALAQTLIYMQTNIVGGTEEFQIRDWDADSGEEYVRALTITEDDVNHGWEIELDLQDKMRDLESDDQARMARYQTYSQDPNVDKYELLKDSIHRDEKRAKRLILPRAVVRQQQEEDRAAALQAQQLGIEQAQNRGQAATPAQQASAGAASFAGA